MDMIASGYGNSGDLRSKLNETLEGVGTKYRFVVVETSGGTGTIGGCFHWEIFGVNSVSELIPRFAARRVRVLEADIHKMHKEVDKEGMVRAYIDALNQEGRRTLLNEVLTSYLLNK